MNNYLSFNPEENYLDLPIICFPLSADSSLIPKPGEYFPLNGLMAVLLCTSGSSSIKIDSNKYELKKGDLFTVTPAHFALVNSISDDFIGVGVHFNFEYYMKAISGIIDLETQLKLAKRPLVSTNEKQMDRLQELIIGLMNRITEENMHKVEGQRKKVVKELIMSLADVLAYEILNIYMEKLSDENVPEQAHNEDTVHKFLQLASNNYMKHRELSFYADKLFITARYLSSMVKAKTGRTALYWITELVISDAKQHLAYTNMSIKQIALRLGFPNQSFFGKYFKNYTGMSPLKYREIEHK